MIENPTASPVSLQDLLSLMIEQGASDDNPYFLVNMLNPYCILGHMFLCNLVQLKTLPIQ